jgi:hypothetical protein
MPKFSICSCKYNVKSTCMMPPYWFRVHQISGEKVSLWLSVCYLSMDHELRHKHITAALRAFFFCFPHEWYVMISFVLVDSLISIFIFQSTCFIHLYANCICLLGSSCHTPLHHTTPSVTKPPPAVASTVVVQNTVWRNLFPPKVIVI